MSILSVPSVAVLAFCVFACSDGEPVSTLSIETVTDKSVYAPGDSVRITLASSASKTANVKWCNFRLQHLVGDDRWVYTRDDAMDCRVPMPVSGKSPIAPYPIPIDLPDGQYRLRDSFFSIVTRPFTIKRS